MPIHAEIASAHPSSTAFTMHMLQVYPFLTSLKDFVNRLTRQQRGSHVDGQLAGARAQVNTGAQMHGELPPQWGFNEILQHNQDLRGQADNMRPYEGVLPQKQQVRHQVA